MPTVPTTTPSSTIGIVIPGLTPTTAAASSALWLAATPLLTTATEAS
jgi:hypothetical protein